MRAKHARFFISFTVLCLFASVSIAAPTTHTISGIVATNDGIGIEGVSFLAEGAVSITETNTEGYYQVMVPEGWSGQIIPEQQDHIFSPVSMSYNNVISDHDDKNYLGSIISFVENITVSVSSGADDGYSVQGNDFYSKEYLSTGYRGDYFGLHLLGVRFISLSIPKGAIVTDVRLKMHSHNHQWCDSGIIEGMLNAEAADNPPNFSTVRIPDRELTTNGVQWDIYDRISDPPICDHIPTSKRYTSPNLASIVQEVIDRPLWSYGSSLVLIYTPRNTNTVSRFDSFEDWPYSNTFAPKLEVALSTIAISGYITNSLGHPVDGVAIVVEGKNYRTLTNEEGYYRLVLPELEGGWSGNVIAEKEGWVFTPGYYSYEAISSSISEQDFIGQGLIVSGYVTNRAGVGIAGVSISTDDESGYDVTNSEGLYELSVPDGWSGMIVPSKNGRNFEPVSRELFNLTDHMSEQNFSSKNTLYVSANGIADFSSIAAAVHEGVDGDEIVLQPGIYSGSNNYDIVISGKGLIIRSIDPNNHEIVASTVIQPNGNSNCFMFEPGGLYESALDGLTFSDCTSSVINCQGVNPIIRNCRFTLNNAPYCIRIREGNPSILNCSFVGLTDTITDQGRAIDIYNNRSLSGVTLIDNCLVQLKTDYSRETPPAISVSQGHADIRNTTIAYNYLHSTNSSLYTGLGLMVESSDVSLKNSIIWGNQDDNNKQITIYNYSTDPNEPLNSHVDISYCNIEGGQESILFIPHNEVSPDTFIWGQGNIDADPLFVREPNDGGDGWFPIFSRETADYSPLHNNDYGDLHLKSEVGRFVWDGFAKADFNLNKRVDLSDFAAMAQYWGFVASSPTAFYPYNLYADGTIDLNDFALFCEDYLQPRVFGAWVQDEVTSPCIDTGGPNDMGWQNELWPHGGRINMGAYGGTPQASMSLNDIGNPVDLNHDDAVDLTDWSLWSDDWGDERVLLDSDFDRNNIVDPNDLNIFMTNWLWAE